MENRAPEPVVLLFDGECGLCSGAVRFIIARDPGRRFRFASLQSEAGRRLVRQHGMADGVADSVVLVENGRVYTKSDAALRVVRKLRHPWPVLAAFAIVPRPLRDAVYDWVARNRYRWFGKQEQCLLPSPDVKELFLDLKSPAN
jgi:predicted DCC family thiol-disulfide oxidoreductase YuxK